MARDLYETLGVKRDTSAEDIKKTYRKLARKLHPDVNPGDAAAEARFKEVSHAYDILSDEKKRKLYDEFGEVGLRDGFDADQARAYQGWSQQRGRGRGAPGGFEGFDGADLGDLFGNIFGGGFSGGMGGAGRGRRQARPMKGQDVEASMELDFLDAVRGCEKSITLRLPTGDGGAEPRTLRVRIPPGASDGGRIRLSGQGAPGPMGGPQGDLLLTLKVQPHPVLTRNGQDLELRLPVTVAEAIKGAKVQVPTLDGPVSLRIPRRSQNGQRMRLKGKGVPQKAGEPGDLYVVLEVTLPTLDEPRLDELADALEALYTTDVRETLKV